MSQQKGGNGESGEFFFGSDAFVPEKDDKVLNGDSFENIETEKDAFLDEGEQNEVPVYESKKERKRIEKSLIKNVFEWLDVVVASVIVVVVLFTFVFRMVAIDGDSMNNTLFNGERVIISNMFYEPKRGDIVVISRNTENSSEADSYKQPIIKRVIAVEGDRVDIDFEAGIVYVNGEALKEKYIKEPTFTGQGEGYVDFPLVVKENCVFVLGDNRNNSMDSRSKSIGDNGQINVKYILGRAILRIFPLNKFGGID